MKLFLIMLSIIPYISVTYAGNECSDLGEYERVFKEEIDMVKAKREKDIQKQSDDSVKKMIKKGASDELAMCKQTLKGQDYVLKKLPYTVQEFIGKESSAYADAGANKEQVAQVMNSILRCYCQVYVSKNESMFKKISGFFSGN